MKRWNSPYLPIFGPDCLVEVKRFDCLTREQRRAAQRASDAEARAEQKRLGKKGGVI